MIRRRAASSEVPSVLPSSDGRSTPSPGAARSSGSFGRGSTSLWGFWMISSSKNPVDVHHIGCQYTLNRPAGFVRLAHKQLGPFAVGFLGCPTSLRSSNGRTPPAVRRSTFTCNLPGPWPAEPPAMSQRSLTRRSGVISERPAPAHRRGEAVASTTVPIGQGLVHNLIDRSFTRRSRIDPMPTMTRVPKALGALVILSVPA
jgi:hypothetical protein